MIGDVRFKDYKPMRILREVIVVAKTHEELMRCYPNAELRPAKKGVHLHSPTCQRYYRPGKAINIPSKQEARLFEALGPTIAMAIPQHRDGYDLPTSGIARSRKSSAESRQQFLNYLASQASRKRLSRLNRPKEADNE